MRDIHFTLSERTEKKYTVLDAVTGARVVLDSKSPKFPMCLDTIRRRQLSDKITLVELNQIQMDIISESYYYGR